MVLSEVTTTTTAIIELVTDKCVVVPKELNLQGRCVEFPHGGYKKYTDPDLFKADCNEIKEAIREFNADFKPFKCVGGGGANVIRIMHLLGEENCSTHVIGIQGTGDKHAQQCVDSLQQMGADCSGLIEKVSNTLRCFSFFWKGKRTMLTLDEGTVRIVGNDLNENTFKNPSKLLLLEGYGVFAQDQLDKATELTKDKIPYRVLILPGEGIIEGIARMELVRLIESNRLTHIFGNLKEFQALTECDGIDTIDDWISRQESLHAVCTMGEKGGYLFKDRICTRFHATQVDCIDDTGAGDAFTAGYLWAMLNDYPADLCIEIATFVASEMVKQIGAVFPNDRHEFIREKVKQIIAANENPS